MTTTVKKKSSNKRRSDSPVYDYMEEVYGDRFKAAQIFSKEETEECLASKDTFNEKCIAFYEMRMKKWKEVTNLIGAEEQEKQWKLREEGKTTAMETYLHMLVVQDSISQRAQNSAGKSFEDAIECLFKLGGINLDQPLKKEGRLRPDFAVSSFEIDGIRTIVTKLYRVSCKTTYRDKENDKDNEVQTGYRGELSGKLLNEFATNKQLLIVILPEHREKTRAFLAKHNIDLVVYDLDSGITELKRRLQNA
jgi:hypothetical protein